METIGFQFGNEDFFVMARKSRDCAEAYIGTPHKQSRRLTQPGQKSTLSGRKLGMQNVACPLLIPDVHRLRRFFPCMPGGRAAVLNSGSYPTMKLAVTLLRMLRKCALSVSYGQTGRVQGSKPKRL